MEQSRGRCSSLSFKALLITQALGALNDNLFKTVVALLFLNEIAKEATKVAYLSASLAFFVLPYVLFSGYAGWLSDRYSKVWVIRGTKLLEVVIMFLGVIGFLLKAPSFLIFVVFLMGFQSALFSPAKYGILPEMLSEEELSKGNGYLELFTFLAIIAGTALAGFSSSMSNPGVLSLLIAFAGMGTSFLIKDVNASEHYPKFVLNPFKNNITFLKKIREQKGLWLTVLGIAYFWFLGGVFQMNIMIFSKEELALTDSLTGILLAILGIGIGIGSTVAGKVSEGKVELGLVPLGALGLTIFSFLLGVTSSYILVALWVFLIGTSSGFFIVPLNAYLQAKSPQKERGRYIASSNFFTFVAVLIASFLFWIAEGVLEVKPSQVFIIISGITVLVSLYLLKLLPEMLARCINWIIIHLFYRIEKINFQNLPKEGGALLVCNHVSYIDAQLLLASIPRPVRFLMYRPIYELALVKPLAKAVGAIPIAAKDGREKISKTLKYCAELIKKGELVGIFAEGGITRDGEVQEFKKGLETIMEGLSEPIVPVALKEVWGSIFSFSEGKVLFKKPKKIPYPVKIIFGKPLPSSAKAY
ncbi:MAG: MFS transporter, partial [Candidatus Dadabacteria bacterium]